MKPYLLLSISNFIFQMFTSNSFKYFWHDINEEFLAIDVPKNIGVKKNEFIKLRRGFLAANAMTRSWRNVRRY